METIPIDISNKICIIGYSGAGKSTLLEYLIRKLNFNKIIIDTTNKFTKKVKIRYKGMLIPKKYIKNAVAYKIQNENDLDIICRNINDYESVPVFLVVDEIDNFTDTHSLSPEFMLYIQQGRNYNHGGVFTVRQVGLLNKQILSNSNYLFLFKIFNKSDIDYLCSITGMNLREPINRLSSHDFYVIDLVNSKILYHAILEKKQKMVMLSEW